MRSNPVQNLRHLKMARSKIDVESIGWSEQIEEDISISGSLTLHGKVISNAEENVNKKAISLDGSNDHILISDQDDFSFTNGSDDLPFSLSAWVYVDDVSSDNGPFITKALVSGGSDGLEYIFKHAEGKLRVFIYRSPGTGNRITLQTDSAVLTDQTWHQVVMTYSGNKLSSGISVYVDGSQITSTNTTLNAGTYTGMINQTTPLILGKTHNDPASAGQAFEDRLADICVFNKELTAAEVAEIYNSGKIMNIRNHSAFVNVVSWWKMGDDQDTADSNGIRDYVSGHHGTLTNGATIIDQTEIPSDALDSLNTNTSGSLGIGVKSPDEALHVYGNTKLEGPLILSERTYDPDNPSEGASVIWMSNGSGSGDDGDVMIKITAGGVTKTVTLVDFSSS